MEFYSFRPEILNRLEDEFHRAGPEEKEALGLYLCYLAYAVTGDLGNTPYSAIQGLMSRSSKLGPEVVNQELALAERAIAQEEEE